MPRDPDADYADTLERAKRASMVQLLIRAARLLNERGLARVREQRVPDVQSSHLQILAHIDLAGTRLTEIARRMGVTKQAAGQVVSEIEALGMVERVPDPSDGRAKLVRFTPHGKKEMLAGIGILRGLQDELEAELGERRIARLHDDLLALVDHLSDAGQ